MELLNIIWMRFDLSEQPQRIHKTGPALDRSVHWSLNCSTPRCMQSSFHRLLRLRVQHESAEEPLPRVTGLSRFNHKR
jgi:hypothetical protein